MPIPEAIHMQILAGFLAPYLVAFATFPLLVGRAGLLAFVSLGACILIAASPWLIPVEFPLLRFLASISAVMLTFKVIDVSLDLKHQRGISWQEYAGFISNPFTLVRRSLAHERRPSRQQNLRELLSEAIACMVAITVLIGLFGLDWSHIPFLVEHVAKVIALMLTISSGLSGAAAIWRLSGGVARDFMDKPFFATTPADFWRRYNRNVQQFFWLNVFHGKHARRNPIRTLLLVFGISALVHEWIFLAAVGRVQGYQMAFFAVQGLAAALTARAKVTGKRLVPWMLATLAFNLLTSPLFFASIHSVAPFYSQALPGWLRDW
jgi:MBOAT, membrane-bound O-acyltransferase family